MPDGDDLICRYKQFRIERWFLITNPIHPSGDLRLQVNRFSRSIRNRVTR